MALVAVLLAAGCGGGEEETGTGAAPGTGGAPGGGGSDSGGEPYKVGVSTATTGPGAQFGAPEAKAAELLFKQLNDAGGIDGRRVELTLKDNATDPQRAVLDVKDFIAGGADAVMVGPVQSVMRAVEPLAQDVLVVNFASGYNPPTPSSIFCPSPPETGPMETTFDWFVDNGIQRFGLMAATDATGETAVKSVQDALTTEAGKGMQLVATERFDPKAPDVTAQLGRLREANPQAIISWVSGSPAGVVAKSFSQLGLDIPLVVSWANGSFAFAKSTQSFNPQRMYVPVVKGLVPDAYPDDEYAKLAEQFVADYQAAYNEKADAGALFALDSFRILVDALKNGESTEERAKFIEGLDSYKGVYGTYDDFSETNHKGGPGGEALAMAQVVDGTLKPIPIGQ